MPRAIVAKRGKEPRGGSAAAGAHSRARRRTSAAASTTTIHALFSSCGSHRLLRRYEPAPVGSNPALSVTPPNAEKAPPPRGALFAQSEARLVRSQAPPRANGGSDSNTPAHSTHPRPHPKHTQRAHRTPDTPSHRARPPTAARAPPPTRNRIARDHRNRRSSDRSRRRPAHVPARDEGDDVRPDKR